eukprot:6028061-Pleurochrysis_carterae.AAC.7
MVAILLDVRIGRDYEPWLLGCLCGPARQALADDVAEAAKLSFKISMGQQVIAFQKYEPFAPGSREFAECTSIRDIAPFLSLYHHDITSAHLEKDATRYSKRLRTKPVRLTVGEVFLGCARRTIGHHRVHR